MALLIGLITFFGIIFMFYKAVFDYTAPRRRIVKLLRNRR